MARLTIVSNSLLYCYGEHDYTQNHANNQTTLTSQVVLQVYGGGGGYEGFRGGVQVGANYYNGSNFSINLAVPGTYILYSRSDTFTHNPDGSFPSGIGLQFNSFSGGSYLYSPHISLNTVIPQIPRASGISVSPATQDIASAVTFYIDRKVSSYTHDLTYNLNGSIGTIATGVGTSYVWTLPNALLSILSNSTSGTMTVTCTTKNGSTVVGTNTSQLTVNVPAYIKPTASLSIEDVGSVPSSWGIWLRAKSRIKGTISATPGYGAGITGYNASANNQVFYDTPFTTDFLTMSGSHTITGQARDSRTRWSDSATQTISIVDYWNPTISNFQVKRCNADGSLNEKGEYAKAIITYSIAPCSNKNTRGLTVSQSGTTKTISLTEYSGTVESEVFENILTTERYTFACSLSDYFTSTPQTFALGTAKRAFSLKHNEEGAAFGETAIDDGLSVAWDANLKKNTKIGKNLIVGVDNLFDKTKYTPISNYFGFDCSELLIGNVYKFTSNINIYWFKISDSRDGNSSIEFYSANGLKEVVFTMRKHLNITGKQYIFVGIAPGYVLPNLISSYDNYALNLKNEINVIVESFSNENVSWTKYSDGTMTCSGRIQMSGVPITSSGNGIFYYILNRINFPQSFINPPTCLLDIDSCSPAYSLRFETTGNGATATQTPEKLILSGTSFTASSLVITYIAYGRWK